MGVLMMEKNKRREINTVEDLADVVNEVVNYVVETSCERTSTGNYIMDADDVSHIISKEDYDKYFGFIANELWGREEVLDLEVDGNLLDAIYGLHWCPNYEVLPEEEGKEGFEVDEYGNLLGTEPPKHWMSLTERAEKFDALMENINLDTLDTMIQQAGQVTEGREPESDTFEMGRE